jgi:very-short-patch-repair endonuclease
MPPKRSTPKTLHQAGELRKQTTPAEKKLWAYLRLMREDGVRFRRQHAIGLFITDFCAPRKKLIIELDGSQHLEQTQYDQERTAHLKSLGYKVIRFWNNDVMNNIEGVIKEIMSALQGNP